MATDILDELLKLPASERADLALALWEILTDTERAAEVVLTSEQNLFQAESNLVVTLGNIALGATAIYRALGGGWQIREDSYFVTAATNEQMRARTDWGRLLPPAGAPQPPAPGLPSPADIGPTVRPPQW